jgi:selenocysteine lyase/cysteine desulfurase
MSRSDATGGPAPARGTAGEREPLAAPDPNLPDPPILHRIREAVIGDDVVLPGPFGPRRTTYADYTASGRALTFVEDLIREVVLPSYANTHSESSGTGLQTTRLREDARAIIRRSVGGDDSTAVIFAGSGATGAIDRLIGILNLRLPADLDRRYHLSDGIPPSERPVVFVGPFEHHSNELPWRESLADVVVIPEDADGHVDLAVLDEGLDHYAHRPLRIGSFSAASNVTGILTDADAVTRLLHAHGALAFWDYAAAGPYVRIDMRPGEPDLAKDAVFLSPHKFIGGPSTPGVLVARKALLTNSVPDVVGGGTVSFVNARTHHYLEDPEHREEGGTPAIVESIRAGLVFAVKDAVGVDVIAARERDLVHRAIARWRTHPSIQILGSTTADRLSIVSFVLRNPSGRFLHHNAAVAMLNDLFGIQSRGGCSCAGPYGHRLLGIDLHRSAEFEAEIEHGCEGLKPGWVRVNFNYFITEPVFRYIIEAVELIAERGWALLGEYRFDLASGLWRHRAGSTEPPIRLTDVGFDDQGRMTWPAGPRRAGEDVLVEQLARARAVLGEAVDRAASASASPEAPAMLTDAQERLRWFELPADLVRDP